MTKPYRYQWEGIRLIDKFDGRALLADPMGLGKSLQALKWAEWCMETKGPIIIVCPASVKYHWQREASTHCNIRAEVLSRMKPPRNKLGKCPIYIINYDILGKGRNSWLRKLTNLRPALVIVDECHYIQSRRTKRTKAVRELCKGVPHVIMIGGTPMTNCPAEMFTALNILHPAEFPSFIDYGYRYCAPQHKPWGTIYKGASNLKELHKRLKKLCMIRRRKEDVLPDLPAKTRHILPLDIPRKEYEAAEKDFISWLRKLSPAKARSAQKAEYLVRRGYLHRLAGELKLSQDIEWIENFLHEDEGKLILFGYHKKVLRPIYEHFKHLSVLVDGSVTGHKRQQLIDKFRHDKKTRLFVGNMKAAGVGWNGTVASNVAFVELYWVPGIHTQAEDRPHRIGQTHPVFIHYLIARNTIEEDMCSILNSKQGVVSSVLDGRKADELNILALLDEKLLKRSGGRRE